MQKGFAPIIIILGIVLILTIVGGIYYLGKSSVKPADNNPKACTQEAKICPDGSSVGRTGPNCEFSPCSEATPSFASDTSPAPTGVGETANWKTYTNEKYGFSVKYPSEANTSIDTYSTGGYMTDGNVHRFKVIFPKELVGRDNFVIEIEDNLLNLSTKEVIVNYVERIKNYKNTVGGTKRIIESLNESLRPYTNNEINGLIGSYGWWTLHPVLVEAQNGKIYTFYMPDSGRYPDDDALKFFDQILSTFKFTQ